MTVLVPKDAGIAVVQGAVVFGRQPGNITSRILRYSYGTQLNVPFVQGVHEPHRLNTIAGVDRCQGVFGKFIDIGTSVEVGHTVSRGYTSTTPNSTSIEIAVFTADDTNPDPKYTDERGCKPLPPLSVYIPQMPELQSISVDYIFGDTVLHIKARDEKTKTPCEARLTLIE